MPRRIPLTKPQAQRVKWIAKELTEGGVPVPQQEIDAACRDFYTGLIPFAAEYGQSLDYIMGSPTWKRSVLVWGGYNTRQPKLRRCQS
jgi:hypothetical protein